MRILQKYWVLKCLKCKVCVWIQNMLSSALDDILKIWGTKYILSWLKWNIYFHVCLVNLHDWVQPRPHLAIKCELKLSANIVLLGKINDKLLGKPSNEKTGYSLVLPKCELQNVSKMPICLLGRNIVLLICVICNNVKFTKKITITNSNLQFFRLYNFNTTTTQDACPKQCFGIKYHVLEQGK